MLASSWIARIRTPNRAAAHALAVAAVVTQAGIAVTGSVVRVTDSGLGCPTWPQCAPGSLVPVAHPESGQVHQWIEFGNRLLGAGVGIVGMLVFLAALMTTPRRRRYILLALAMPLGVLAQAVIGGVTVLTKLTWWTVSLHFLPSPVLVWLAVLLVYAVHEGDQPPRPLIPRPLRGLQVAMVTVLGCLLVAGTLVTAAGPHAGDAHTPRLNLPIDELAQSHAGFLYIFLGLLAVFGFGLRRAGANRRLWWCYWLLVAAVLAQGALGVTQYALGVPDVLVALHVLGSMLVVAALAALWGASRDRGSAPAPADATPAADNAAIPAAAGS